MEEMLAYQGAGGFIPTAPASNGGNVSASRSPARSPASGPQSYI